MAQQVGFTERDVANNLLVSLAASGQTRRPTGSTRDRRQLPRRRADAAVPDRFARRARQHLDLGGDGSPRPQVLQARRTSPPRRRAGGGHALQRARRSSTSRRTVRGRRPRRGRAARDADSSPSAEGGPRGSSVASAGQVETMRTSFGGLVAGLGLRGAARLPADGRQLPVVARSVHHPDGAAGRARGHRLDAVPHARRSQRAGADGRDHVRRASRRRTASWSSRSRTTAANGTLAPRRRARRRDDAAPPGDHDRRWR